VISSVELFFLIAFEIDRNFVFSRKETLLSNIRKLFWLIRIYSRIKKTNQRKLWFGKSFFEVKKKWSLNWNSKITDSFSKFFFYIFDGIHL